MPQVGSAEWIHLHADGSVHVCFSDADDKKVLAKSLGHSFATAAITRTKRLSPVMPSALIHPMHATHNHRLPGHDRAATLRPLPGAR
jgi:hypothetical protein